MVTKLRYKCGACDTVVPKRPSMFKALKRAADNMVRPCPECNADLGLHLSFAFALGAKKKDAAVLASYYPKPLPEPWTDKKDRKVTFIPFLVILKRSNGEGALWLPYFHAIDDGKKCEYKYGQWAPFMKMEVFDNLIQQARLDGYLLPDHVPGAEKTAADEPVK